MPVEKFYFSSISIKNLGESDGELRIGECPTCSIFGTLSVLATSGNAITGNFRTKCKIRVGYSKLTLDLVYHQIKKSNWGKLRVGNPNPMYQGQDSGSGHKGRTPD